MDVNWLAVIASAVVSMIIGSIWYGPLLGKRWLKLVSFTKEELERGKKDMPKTYSLMFAGSLVTSFVLALTIGMAPVTDMVTGVIIAFWVWVGFVVAVKLSDVLFEKKPWELFIIESGYYLVFLVVAGAIIGSWR